MRVIPISPAQLVSRRSRFLEVREGGFYRSTRVGSVTYAQQVELKRLAPPRFTAYPRLRKPETTHELEAVATEQQ